MRMRETRLQMRKDQLIVLVVFALIVGAVVGLQPFAGDKENHADPAKDAPRKATRVREFRGFSMQMHYPYHPYEQYVEDMTRTGANTVCLVVAGYQENCSSTSIFVEGRKTPDAERLRKLIRHAREQGLCVAMMPIVLLENAREGEWRGKISPDRWDDWWQDYNDFVLHYAKLAQSAGVELFLVGSELVSTESQEGRWRDLIGQVRKVYKGRLSYSANWDHYRPIKWWDAVDIIGMTTYYDLTKGDKPTLDRLMKSWKTTKKDILEWQAKINRPILFTEVGWPNQVTCAQYPWDYYRSQGKPDPQAQANCFEAFFRTWADQPQVAGFLIWEWMNHPSQEISELDTSYVPLGKPLTMKVIRKYLTFASPATREAAEQEPATQSAAARSR